MICVFLARIPLFHCTTEPHRSRTVARPAWLRGTRLFFHHTTGPSQGRVEPAQPGVGQEAPGCFSTTEPSQGRAMPAPVWLRRRQALFPLQKQCRAVPWMSRSTNDSTMHGDNTVTASSQYRLTSRKITLSGSVMANCQWKTETPTLARL